MMRKTILAAALCVLGAGANAAPFFFDEATDTATGDFQTFGIVNVGTVDVGYNEVLGALDGNCVQGDCNPPSGGGDSQDTFEFDIAAGLEVTTISLAAEGSPLGLRYSGILYDVTSGRSFVSVATFDINTGGDVFNGFLGEGTYELSVYGQTSPGVDGPFGAVWSYGIEAQEVQAPAVPLPAVLPLLIAGLGGFAIVKRRTRG